MHDQSVEDFRALIAARLAEIDAEDALGADGQQTVTLDQQSVGRLSRMDALQNQAMAKATQARRDLERARLAAALARMDEGEFGFCEDCGDKIPDGRLRLDPAATRCVSCLSG
ncbi:TraR/DksA C4-type zinc finger protein [Rhodobacteraceae bacterium D3-12]|nr:TraR/DksA C4-type zinc finger protein [Rhodobacteraceae bacterium D3-12]